MILRVDHVDIAPGMRLLLFWIFIGFFLSPSQCFAGQKIAPISELVAEPAAIKVARFDRGTATTMVTVIARAGGAAGFPVDPKLTFTASPGLEVKIGDRTVAAGDIVWPVSVRATDGAPDGSAVDFRLAYTEPSRNTAKARHRGRPNTTLVQRARLTVTVAPSQDASPVADADLSIKIDFTSIIYGVPAKAYILVKNNTAYPLTLKKPAIDKPDFLTATVAPLVADRTSVLPHETLRVPFDISISKSDKSRVGEWLILAKVTLSRGEGAGERTGTAVLEQKVTVGVPGVSDILKALDLPSLLLAPGALVLATWSLLLGAGDAAKPKWLEWKSSSFWVVSITISIIIFAVASMIWDTNFFVAYNVDDVAKLWLGCVGVSAGTFALYRFAEKGLNNYRATQAETERQAREPLTTDKPIAIMRKLNRANLRFYLEGYERRSVTGQDQQIFKIDFPAPYEATWAVPRMLLRQLKNDQAANDVIQQITTANNRPADGRAPLMAALELGLAGNLISLDWQDGDISGPRLLPTDDLGTANERNSPIEFA